MTGNNSSFGSAYAPPVQTTAIWSWNTGSGLVSVSGYPQGNGVFTPTKTGLTPIDLQNAVGVPLVYYGNPSTAVASGVIQDWIRQAEDTVEQETSILLCQTWVASPPTTSAISTNACGLIVNQPSVGFQQLGIDYDLQDTAYDFMFPRAQDSAWLYQVLRYRPIVSFAYGVSGAPDTIGLTAVKNTAFIYPLLNQFFRIPPTWNVEDADFGLIRYVPAVNVQMLPLFAMQLAFMGFTENVPGALWVQYTAGLRPVDYQSRYNFMKRLVLVEAAMIGLATIQGTINLGLQEITTTVDGLSQKFRYPNEGPYAPLIATFKRERDALMDRAKNLVSGPMINSI